MLKRREKQNPVNIAPLPEWKHALDRAWRYEDAPQPDCKDRPDEFTDYHLTLPSDEEAWELCAACPLLEICGKSARYERPAWGVRAGFVWIGGLQANVEDRKTYLQQLAGHSNAGRSMILELGLPEPMSHVSVTLS